jgi:hypothetical protein
MKLRENLLKVRLRNKELQRSKLPEPRLSQRNKNSRLKKKKNPSQLRKRKR